MPNAPLHLLLEEKRTLPLARKCEVVVDANRGIWHADAIYSRHRKDPVKKIDEKVFFVEELLWKNTMKLAAPKSTTICCRQSIRRHNRSPICWRRQKNRGGSREKRVPPKTTLKTDDTNPPPKKQKTTFLRGQTSNLLLWRRAVGHHFMLWSRYSRSASWCGWLRDNGRASTKREETPVWCGFTTMGP